MITYFFYLFFIYFYFLAGYVKRVQEQPSTVNRQPYKILYIKKYNQQPQNWTKLKYAYNI